MVTLNIAFHGCLPGDDVDQTNLWFDAEVNPQDLLDAMEGDTYEGMTRLLSDCYDETDTFYRMVDNQAVEWVGDKWNHDTSDALGYDEWHVDVDWGNGRYLCLLGAGFGDDESDRCEKEVRGYLTELVG